MRFALQKRADLSMSTIVMAIIALLILIVLATMIVRNLGGTNDQLNKCETLGGKCYDSCTDQFGPNAIVKTGWYCYADSSAKIPDGRQCCVSQ